MLWGSLWGSRGGFGGAQGGQRRKPPRPDGSRDLPVTENQCSEASWLQPMRPKRYKYRCFRASPKNKFFLKNGTSGISGGSRGGSKSGGGAPAGSQGALGKVDQVHWGPFFEVLDLQEVARA